MAFRKNHRKTKKRGGAATNEVADAKTNAAANEGAKKAALAIRFERAKAEANAQTGMATEALEVALQKVISNEITSDQLDTLIENAEDYNVNEELIDKAKATKALNDALKKVDSNKITSDELDELVRLNRLIKNAENYNVNEELIHRAEVAVEELVAADKEVEKQMAADKEDEDTFRRRLKLIGALKAVDDELPYRDELGEPVDTEQRKKMMKKKGSFHKDSYATKNIKSVSKELLETYSLQLKNKSQEEYNRVHELLYLLYPDMTKQYKDSKTIDVVVLRKKVDNELERLNITNKKKIEELNVQLLKPLAIFVYQNYTNNFEIDIKKIKNIILVINENPSLKYTIYGHVTKILLPYSNAEKQQSMKELNQLYKRNVPNHSSGVLSRVFKPSMKDQLDTEEAKANAIDTFEVLGKKSTNRGRMTLKRQPHVSGTTNELERKVEVGGKRRNTRRHKKKANQTHRKKHRRNSRKKHNTRRKR